MSGFKGEDRSLGFGTVADGITEGISSGGMEDYLGKLQIDLLQSVSKALWEVQDLETAINKGWQGVSRDKFLEKFNSAIKATEEDLHDEYRDLVNKLSELSQNYYEQDAKMMDMI